MLYQPPYVEGATPAVPGIHNANADAGYSNGDALSGTEGSYVPGEAIEHTQRELVRLLVAAGITPDVAVLTQVAEASARMASLGVYGVDGGDLNACVISAANGNVIAPKALFDGLVVRTRPAVTNTGSVTANVFGLGVKPVRTWGDAALDPGELVAGRHTVWQYSTAAQNGGGAWLLVPWASALHDIFITQSVTKTVGPASDFADLDAAQTWLKTKIIVGTAIVTLALTAGVHTYAATVTWNYRYSHRVKVVGANMLAAAPTAGSFAVTGNSGGARTADAATNIAMLRTKYATELRFTGSARLLFETGPMEITNILVVGSGAAAVGLELKGAVTTVRNVSLHGWGGDGFYATASYITVAGSLTASGCSDDGIEISDSSHLYCYGGLVVSSGNAAYGMQLNNTSSAELIGAMQGNGSTGLNVSHNSHVLLNGAVYLSTNGGGGLSLTQSSFYDGGYVLTSSSNSGGPGVAAYHGASGKLANVVSSNNGTYGFVATNGANISIAGYTAVGNTSGVSSPAVNTSGNGNAYIATI